jgi:hypothetical protein
MNISKTTRSSSTRIKTIEDLKPLGYQKYFDRHAQEDGTAIVPYFNDTERDAITENNNWTYFINSAGFRGNWNLNSKKQKIGFFGCSFTSGEGNHEDDLFVNKVATHFDLEPFNLGVGGASLERVAKIFSAANKVIDIDYAVITLPGWTRQTFLEEDGRYRSVILGWTTREEDKLFEKFLLNVGDEYFINYSVTMINWIIDAAQAHNVKIIINSWDSQVFELLKVLTPELCAVKSFPNVDNGAARDTMHPGPKSQDKYAEQIINEISNRNWLDKLPKN